MSTSDARKILKTEIGRLNFTQDERTRLLKYFTENKDRQDEAMFFLPEVFE